MSLLLALFFSGVLRAQQNPFQLQSYRYSTGVGTSASWLSPALVHSSIVAGDDVASSVLNLGFSFVFEGVAYTQFSVNTNGNFRLGSTRIASGYYATPLSTTNVNYNTPKIVPVGADLKGYSLTYGISGTAPNRVGVYSFKGSAYGSSDTLNFQLQLYESTGEIRIVYGAFSRRVLSRNFQVGIAGSLTDVAVVDQNTHTVSYGATSAASTTWPGLYRYYSFIPDTIMCPYPYNLIVSAIGHDSVLLSWNLYGGMASSANSFIVEYGVAGFVQGTGTQVSATSSPIVIHGLQPDVGYNFYVRTVCDTVDTSGYSKECHYIYCSNQNNGSCIDFTNLRAPGVVCTYGLYNYYGQTSSSYPGPYADTGVVDLGPGSYGRSSSMPGSRHTVNTNPLLRDPLCPQISRIPPGECSSVRLGSYYGGYICQSVSYNLTVDTMVADLLLLKYACVFNDANHGTTQQPRFVLEILDQQGNLISPACGTADYSATDVSSGTVGGTWYTLSGAISFMDTIVDSVTGSINVQQLSYSSHTIRARDWTPLGFNIAAYHGQTVVVRITSYSCGQSGPNHCGYVYYTLSCDKAKIRSSSCSMGEQTTLSAPIGFIYKWYSSLDTTHVISTNRQVNVILDSTSYFCKVSFVDDTNCSFRISYNHVFQGDTIRDTLRKMLCPGDFFIQNGDTMSAPGWYRQELTSAQGCDSILAINVVMRDTLRDTIRRVICAGAAFDTNGQSYSQTGMYSQLLRDSVSRCYTRLYISLTVRDTLRDTIRRVICAGATFDTNGRRYSQTGMYSQLLRDSASRCYTRLYINLTVRDTFRNVIWQNVCAGAAFTHGGQSYSLQGTYLQRYSTIYGCDSITEIHLTVNDTLRDTVEHYICAGQTVLVNGQMYYRNGWYRQTLRTHSGCDSILHIRLVVADTIRDTLFINVCAGKVVEVNGQTYSVQGWYRQTLRTHSGCDSILHIALIVDDTIRSQAYDTICNGGTYLYHDSIYTTSGLYRHRLKTHDGCDSIVALRLFVLDTAVTHIYDTIERGDVYNFFGRNCTEQGVYSHVLVRQSNGCDSTVVLHLKVCRTIFTNVYDTVCTGALYLFGDTLVASSGEYSRVEYTSDHCDSVIILYLTVIDRPTLELVDSGSYCRGGVATLVANTNANYILWSSYPADTSLVGQENQFVIRVSPNRLVEYSAMVDIQPYNCVATGSIVVGKPNSVKAAMLMKPSDIYIENLQVLFTDISIGEVVARKWLFHEDSPAVRDRIVHSDSLVYYTASAQSDSLEVSLAVENANGCRDTVTNIYPICKGDIWVPNVFTPSRQSSGKNHLFRVGYNNVVEYEINIYSRAGLLVFHSTDPDISWDGTHNYKDCVVGNYVYVIRYTTKRDPKKVLEKKGSVLLLR